MAGKRGRGRRGRGRAASAGKHAAEESKHDEQHTDGQTERKRDRSLSPEPDSGSEVRDRARSPVNTEQQEAAHAKPVEQVEQSNTGGRSSAANNEQSGVVDEFFDAVNMSRAELEEWLQTVDSKKVGWTRDGESEAVGRLTDTPQHDKHAVCLSTDSCVLTKRVTYYPVRS